MLCTHSVPDFRLTPYHPFSKERMFSYLFRLEMHMKGLTERQVEVLVHIARSMRSTGYPPTIREIGLALDIRSTNGVNDHLKALERKRFIERDDAKSRALTLTREAWDLVGPMLVDEHTETGAAREPDPSRVGMRDPVADMDPRHDVVSIPLLGRIAAGNPIEAIERVEDRLAIDASLLGRSAGAAGAFALRIRGDSMTGDGILDGDLIVVRRQQTARQGEIVAVMVDGSATVKRYFAEGSRVRLQPSNPALEPIYLSAEEARETAVLGRVVAVYRSL
jgi:repressor LexA